MVLLFKTIKLFMRWHDSKSILNCFIILLNTLCWILLHKYSKHCKPSKSCLCLVLILVLMTALVWLFGSLERVWSYTFQS